MCPDRAGPMEVPAKHRVPKAKESVMRRQRSSGRKSSVSITSLWEACYAPAPRVPPISRGKIDDIIIDQNNVMFAVLQVGGFLGVGSHLVAVPYDSLKVAEDGKKVELPGASKDELKKLAEFKYLG
jgi:hypothetical protein